MIQSCLSRAGRPGFDTEGVAVIMTSSEEKKNYEKMSLSADIVESRLPSILVEGEGDGSML
jgi:replicative superfamily II helicase